MRHFHFLITFLLTIFFAACSEIEKQEVQILSTHIGLVLDDNTNLPLSNMDVVVTDGNNIHAKTLTKNDGSFSVEVKSSHINSAYYILVGNEHTEQKKVPLQGFGNATYDVGTIRIKGATIPEVRTIAAKDVTSNSATCSGEVLSTGGYDVYQRGLCYSTSHAPSLKDTHTSEGKGIGTFSSKLSNLTNNVTYYVRAYAINEIGVAYGSEVSFKTIEGLPSVQTSAIYEVTSYTIKCGGVVTDEGGAPILMRGVCWSTDNKNPTINDNKTENGDGSGTYKSTIEGINITEHQYYIRAYATNRYGTSYGEVIIQKNVNPFGLPTIATDKLGINLYMVLPYDMAAKTFEGAKAAAGDLEAYGYDDWFLPFSTEIYELMYAEKDKIGGFQNKQYWTSETAGCDMDLWECYASTFDFSKGTSSKDNVDHLNPSRPIRKIKY